MMDSTRQTEYHEILTTLAQRLADDKAAIYEQAHSTAGNQTGGEVASSPGDLGDRASEESLPYLDVTLLENKEYLSKEVQEALGRLEDSTFGLCDACGEAIAEERLDAIPYTRYCASCAERLEPLIAANYNIDHLPDSTEILSFQAVMETILIDDETLSSVEDQGSEPRSSLGDVGLDDDTGSTKENDLPVEKDPEDFVR